MKYQEAYELMKDGHAVSRGTWDYVTADGVKDEKFNVMFKDVNYVMSFRYFPNPQFGNYIPLIEDLEADDWYVKNVNWNQPTVVEAVQGQLSAQELKSSLEDMGKLNIEAVSEVSQVM